MSLTLVIGPMFAGKTSRGQFELEHFQRKGMKTLVITHASDERYTGRQLLNASHGGLAVPCIKVAQLTEKDVDVLIDDNEFIWVDEGQFMGDELVAFCVKAVRNEKHVLVTALQSDVNRNPWPNVSALIPHADKVICQTAYCIICNQECKYTRKVKIEKEPTSVVVDPGGEEKYVPACDEHFFNPFIIPQDKLDARKELNASIKKFRIPF